MVESTLKMEEIDVTSMRGTPLHIAASQGNIKIINVLMTRAPQWLNLKDGLGKTPREVATGKNVQNLLDKYLKT